MTPATELPPTSGLAIALVHPQIAPNTGNIARLCVVTGTALHLVRPLGFCLTDRMLRRSAMDYWPQLRLTVHNDDQSFLAAMSARRLWLTDSSGRRSLWDATFAPGDVLVFGSETRGLPEHLIAHAPGRLLRIPQSAGTRCLNLSSAAAVVLYEALRQLCHAGAPAPPAARATTVLPP